jgi:membrane fusion protein (multidrug efflux system)
MSEHIEEAPTPSNNNSNGNSGSGQSATPADANVDANSDAAAAKTKQQPSPEKKRRLKRILIIAGIVVLVLGLLFFIRWWMTGRFFESTNDAYLKADSVVISPKVSGYVSAVYVADNQPVKAGQPLVTLDGRQYQAALDQARATIDGRKADIAKAQAQAAQQQSSLQQARSQLAAAQSSAAHADREVERYAPLAPAAPMRRSIWRN